MRQSIGVSLVAFVVACIPLGAATMPTIIVTNNSDSLVQITPIDEAHKPPAPLDQVSATLPPGAFILTNRTATPINAVVTLWSFTDSDGNVQQKRFTCDGYLGGGVPSAIIRANDSTLISPGGCMMREYFAHYVGGGPMLGAETWVSTNKSITVIAEKLTTVRITIDSVIFEDGRIWGPDAHHYYKTVSIGYWATRSVVEEVLAAKAAGQDMKVPLKRILAEPSGKADPHRKLCASNIHDSPDPEATLKFYSQQPPLPEFRHIGEENK